MKSINEIYLKSTHLLTAMLICLSCFGQIEEIESTKSAWVTIGKVKWLANTRATLKYSTNGRDTIYMLYLQDDVKLKNSSDMTVYNYFSLSFDGAGNTLNKLYDLLMSFFSDENRKNKSYEKTFRLGKDMVLVRHFNKLTAKSILLATGKNHITFTEKELKKLFGR